METKPLTCELHDYLEIACLYRYRVKLHLKDQTALEGVAIDVASRDGHEYLLIEAGEKRTIDLNELVKLQVLTPNAKFTEVMF